MVGNPLPLGREDVNYGHSWPVYSNGDQGEAVYSIQYLLEDYGYNLDYHDGIYGSEVETTVESFQSAENLSVDGYYGPETKAAVRDFQSNAGITVDGIIGHDTWQALMAL